MQVITQTYGLHKFNSFFPAGEIGILSCVTMHICLCGIDVLKLSSNSSPLSINFSAKFLTTQPMPKPLLLNWTIKSLVASSNSGLRVVPFSFKKASTYFLVLVLSL